MKIRLFPKFLITIVAISIIPLTVIGIVTFNINKEILRTTIFERHIEIVTSLASKIDDTLKNIDRRMAYFIASQGGRELSQFEEINFLRSLLVASDDFIRAGIIDNDGDETVASNPKYEKTPPHPENYEKNEYYNNAKKSRRYQIAPLYYDNGNPRMDFYFPYSSNRMIKITVSMDYLLDFVKSARIGKTGYSFVVDSKGNVVLGPQRAGENGFTAKETRLIKEAISRFTIGSSEYIDDNKVEMIGSFAPVSRLGWNVVFRQEKSEAYYYALKMRSNAVLIIVISIFISVLVVWLLARSLSRPILDVINVSKKVASGDFSQMLHVKTRDEMKDLEENFNNMIKKMDLFTKMQADKLQAIIYSINDGLILTDENTEIVLMNESASKILGVEKSLRGQLIEAVKNEQLRNAIKEVSSKPQEVKEVDIGRNKPHVLSISSQIVYDPNEKKPVGIIFVMRDVTKEKEIEKMKEDFIHGITHDLRNPLTSILGFLKFLLDGLVGPVNEKQKQFLITINQSSLRLLGLINNILDVAKMEAGKMEINIYSFEVQGMVQRVINALMDKAIENKIELTHETPQLTLKADEGLIERVLINLVGNALKHTSREGKVWVTVKEEEKDMVFTVHDTGEGIPQEFLGKIFEKFQQVDSKRKSGTGIGLTISKYIVEAHLGKIWAESELGVGSRFIFTIPKNLKKLENGAVST